MTEPAPDIHFTARVRAESLRFHAEPDVRVEFTGAGTSEAVRSGLPKPVRADVTYRDVQVDYRLVAFSGGLREESAEP